MGEGGNEFGCRTNWDYGRLDWAGHPPPGIVLSKGDVQKLRHAEPRCLHFKVNWEATVWLSSR